MVPKTAKEHRRKSFRAVFFHRRGLVFLRGAAYLTGMKDLLVWAPEQKPRLSYVLNEVVAGLLGWSYECTSSEAVFAAWPGPKCSYGREAPAHSPVHFAAADLLWEAGPRVRPLSTFTLAGDLPGLFPVLPGGAMPYDPLAAIFFLLSRYEEYLPFTPDGHGRFPAHQSWAYRAACLDQPVAVYWARQWAACLRAAFPRLPQSPRSYRFVPTYDLDKPWAVARPGARGLARAALDLGLGRSALNELRGRVWHGREADPFFTFPWLEALHRRTGLPARMFFLVSDGLNRYDINPATWRGDYRRLIRGLREWAEPGLHPSYRAGEKLRRLTRERRRLEQLLGEPVLHSRQHFLRFTLPVTYRLLLEAGLRTDHGMGFADAVGYRAGTSEPFRWYDLEREQPTELEIRPFVAMDVTLRRYLALGPERAAELLADLQDRSRRDGLTFQTLWHNSSFSPYHGWAGWREVYEGLFRALP